MTIDKSEQYRIVYKERSGLFTGRSTLSVKL